LSRVDGDRENDYNVFMQNRLKQIHALLLKKRRTVAAAESCTGGLLSAALTSLPGSSAYFLLGAVTYSNAAKSKILGIPAKTIKTHGAVSAPVCEKMADSVRKLAKSAFGIAITGIAGPSGAVPGKPVGTVFIAVTDEELTVCCRFRFKGGREAVREQSRDAALNMLFSFLL